MVWFVLLCAAPVFGFVGVFLCFFLGCLGGVFGEVVCLVFLVGFCPVFLILLGLVWVGLGCLVVFAAIVSAADAVAVVPAN